MVMGCSFFFYALCEVVGIVRFGARPARLLDTPSRSGSVDVLTLHLVAPSASDHYMLCLTDGVHRAVDRLWTANGGPVSDSLNSGRACG